MDVNKNDEIAWYIDNSWAPSTPLKPIQSRTQPIQAATVIDEPNGENSLNLEDFPPGFPHKIQNNASNFSYNPSNNIKEVEESYNLEANCHGSERDTDWSANTGTGTGGLFSNLLALASSGQTTSTSEVQGRHRTLDDLHHSVSNSGTCERVRSIIASYPELDFLLGPSISCSAAYACEHLDPQSHGHNTSLPQTMMKDVVSQKIIPQFAPITPQKPDGMEWRISEKEHLSTDAQTGQEHNRQENIIAPTDLNTGELEHTGHLELSGDLNCATDLILSKENHDPQDGDNQIIDVDKTPQKKERRRKHRPKVVTEGKPKRKPRQPTSKPTNNIDPKTGKRKYVRRKGIEKPQSSLVEAVSNPDPNTTESGPTKKTCRRKLNFDMEGQVMKETFAGQPPHASESQAENSKTACLSSKSCDQLDKEVEDAGKRASPHVFEFDLNTNPRLKDSVPSHNEEETEREATAQNIMSQEKLGLAFEMDNIGIQATGHEMSTQMDRTDNKLARPQCDSYSICLGLMDGNQVNASKRKYPVLSGEANDGSMNLSGVQSNNLQKYDKMFKSYFPYLHNKDESNFDQYCMLNTSPMAPTEKIGRLNHPLDVYRTNPLEQNCSNWISTTQTNASRIPATFGEMQKVLQDKQQEVCCILESGKTAGSRHAYGDSTNNSCIATTMNYMGPPYIPKQGANNEVQGNIIIYNHRQIVPKSLGGRRKILKDQTVSISVIIRQFKRLNINKGIKKHARRNQKTSRETRIDEQSALVLYQRDGTIVPFSGPFNTPKRRHERPKVDLDSETTRVWMLLLEDINSKGIDGTDEEKAKWWEEERRVFKGRADSFIARMHLVQGDRRFSKWKGSVVDSVVGVYLTQNVSDHLSSSAFMSIAARFPCNTDKRPCCDEGFEAIVDDAQTCLSGSEITNKQNETNQRLDIHCSMLHGTIEHKKEEVNNNAHVSGTIFNSSAANESEFLSLDSWWSSNVSASHSVDNISAAGVIGAEPYSVEGGKRWENKESTLRCSANSSPTSAESSITQASERTEASCLGNNTKADGTNRPNSFLQLLHDVQNVDCSPDSGNVSSGDHLQLMHNRSDANYDKERLDISILESLEGHLDHVHSTGVSEVDCTETFQGESISFEETKHANRNCDSGQITLPSELSIQNSTTGSDETTSSFNENSQPRKCSLQEKDLGRWIGGQNTAERLSLSYNDNNQQSHRLPDLMGEQVQSVHTLHNDNNQKLARTALSNQEHAITKEAGGNNLKASGEKLRKVKKLKEEEFDWDSLRKQAEKIGAKRERTEKTMDSVDWEAVRSADVNEIANTIKERGMNNRLAARIKDFLNRLVEKHGSIDLEWLRDVPPDKAKEYLLSFKGLGLKSVECVRLLTLHHLAFPVDTNVGRIAVRLGWVPLQPLPESLQLHLLELYPVLESIQQYLWPRLCKLDQRTLYELHYQMITFGKVFCTKSKPNCNACPMRGECRHFASAFASARLALPPPEERGRVDEMQKAIAQIPSRLELLPPASQSEEKSQEKQLQEVRSEVIDCQPIIEEPASPEQPYSQVSEQDIEDVIPEDSDEIPTIKLNMEAFTLNLQSYVQQNMELQVSEMSKALVALTPEAASVPVPKLKNISRLRTEHLVYEIPEGHPLLNGMDRLEPDDPSKYLLAIWSPGETATSIQPPDRTCNLHEFGGLCDDITCVSCTSRREANSQIVRGTFLIPCRTAMRGSFPLNGTYFQVNEVFADHDSSLNPIDVPRNYLWNLPRRTVYFGTSVTAIFKGLSTEAIQHCFWRGYVCVRGFDRKTRSPRPLMARLHFPPSRLAKNKSERGDRRT